MGFNAPRLRVIQVHLLIWCPVTHSPALISERHDQDRNHMKTPIIIRPSSKHAGWLQRFSRRCFLALLYVWSVRR
ncbi:hypothetical protein EDD37DRAFT_616889 [Exophiala viscosa]|uniref:uncharacterized protein n=1 Tax=Exophiala viscosa TaxID=2486360 RepID=UPI00218EE576|nr:hypothetical protein EDD37DRAFT_616889 [Exophiala viscosa]